MQSKAKTVDEYIKELPADRAVAVEKLRKAILKNIPKGFEETMNYGMIGYVVPHSIYPAGYHCDPKLPVPFMNIASQKNSINFYHMAFYVGELEQWFKTEWSKATKMKLDMGKSCVRMKKLEEIPFELIGKLASKMTVKDWISAYEKAKDKK